MEVHHHPHAGKKKFKEFLLEGLMIFIAVTLGFLAESLRENISHNAKEREYVHSLINNLQDDENSLKSTLSDNLRKIKALDTLLSLDPKKMIEMPNRRLLYSNLGMISFYSTFTSNDATLMQLKNAGGLQYIRRAHVADSIAKYDQEIRNLYKAEEGYSKAINEGLNAYSSLIEFRIFNDSASIQNGHFSEQNLPLLGEDLKSLNVLFNKLYLERGWTQNYVNNINQKLPYVQRLISLLRNQYNFK
jgi:hypothetical protein